VQQKEWVQFIADRSTIDSLQQAYPTLSIVCITLLRMYSGIYYYPTSIHIVDLSKKLRTSFEETRNLLNKLHSLGFINYQAPVEGPKIWFHHTRVASEHLIVNEEQIAFLRNRQIERLKALFAFIKEKDKCRNQILLPYFGEEKNAACMHCDICESARKMNIQKSTILIEKDLIEFIKKNSGLSLDSLYTQFNEINKETLHACLRQLIDDSKISYKNQLFY
jgi:ATP-dependent DNA helicase RecQ